MTSTHMQIEQASNHIHCRQAQQCKKLHQYKAINHDCTPAIGHNRQLCMMQPRPGHFSMPLKYITTPPTRQHTDNSSNPSFHAESSIVLQQIVIPLKHEPHHHNLALVAVANIGLNRSGQWAGIPDPTRTAALLYMSRKCNKLTNYST